jgi:uncharacterized protein YjbJ (UPF0337 family)
VVDSEKIKGQAELLKNSVEQAIGKTTWSKQMRHRGNVDEVVVRARRAVADARSDVTNTVGKAKHRMASR